MKFYSEKTKKLYNTQEELDIAEKKLLKEEEEKALSKKHLAKKVEKANERYELAVAAYDETQKKVDALIAETKTAIEEMWKAPLEELHAAKEARIAALQEFNNKFGVYTTTYSGERAAKEFDRLLQHFTWWDAFNPFF